MGIGGITNQIKNAKKRMTLPDIKNLVCGDESICKIAIDTAYVTKAIFSSVWKEAFNSKKILLSQMNI